MKEGEGGGGPGFLMTQKIMAEQAIKMNKGGGKGGRRNKGAGQGRVAVSMLTFPERGKKRLL